MPVFFGEEGNMKNYRIKKNFRALAAVLGLSRVWGSAASAEPSADNGAKVEVSIVQKVCCMMKIVMRERRPFRTG